MTTHIFFDLDGTLTEPFLGITTCVKYSLERFGIKTECEDHRAFIGPPLLDSYMKYYGFSEKDAERAVAYYRERYTDVGILECELYDGVRDMLEHLSHHYTLVLATSKPEPYALRILEHFDIKRYFTHAVGASFDKSLAHKTDVLREALRRSGADPATSVMVGDRDLDTLGAKENSMRAVGVLYGYGKREEHESAEFVAESVQALEDYFLTLAMTPYNNDFR